MNNNRTEYFYKYDTKFGPMVVAASDNAITRVDLGVRAGSGPAGAVLAETPLIKSAAAQIFEYLNGERKEFDAPVSPGGTDFMKKVWKALSKIRYGETKTYGQIAREINEPEAARAVGAACGRNPVMIIIPCHRVIGADGSLTGYAGGIDIKEKLLRLEGVHK